MFFRGWGSLSNLAEQKEFRSKRAGSIGLEPGGERVSQQRKPPVHTLPSVLLMEPEPQVSLGADLSPNLPHYTLLNSA